MKNLLLILISTAITSIGAQTNQSFEYATSNGIEKLNDIITKETQETTSNLFIERYVVSDYNTAAHEDVNTKKETFTLKNTLDLYKFDSSKMQTTFINFNYKVNLILFRKGIV